MKLFKTVSKYVKGHDLSTAKEKLAEDVRKWGNFLLIASLASLIFTEKTFVAILSKLVGIDGTAELAVNHPWVFYLAFGTGFVMRASAFILDIKPKSKASSKTT